MNASEFYVYVLFRRNGIPFWVGKGKGRRWTGHEQEARTSSRNDYRLNIIRAMQKKGLDVPKIKIAEGLTEAEAFELEILFIRTIGRRPNGPLVNLSDGGEGSTGHKMPQSHKDFLINFHRGRKHSAETRAKISASNKGRVNPLASRQAQAAKIRGRKASEETRRKISVSHKGLPCAEGTRRAMSETNRRPHFWITDGVKNSKVYDGGEIPAGWRRGSTRPKHGIPNSPEQKKKSRESHLKRWAVEVHPLKGRPMPLETRAKISASKMGHTVSEETRLKISKARLSRSKKA
jgi:hypothetical protein